MRFFVVVAIITTVLSVGNVDSACAQGSASARLRQAYVPEESGHSTVGQDRTFPRSRVGIWVGRSFLSGSVLGSVQQSHVGLVGLRFSRLLIPTSEQVASGYEAPTLTYTADLIPLGHVGIPVESLPNAVYPGRRSPVSDLSTYGTGAYPLGLRVAFRSKDKVRPFLAGHTGILYFFDHVPDNRGRKMNFAAGVGGGVIICFTTGANVTIGYRYHHLSNGFRGSINPGLDANVLFLGVGTSL